MEPRSQTVVSLNNTFIECWKIMHVCGNIGEKEVQSAQQLHHHWMLWTIGFNYFLYTILVSMAHDREYLSIRRKLKYTHRRRNRGDRGYMYFNMTFNIYIVDDYIHYVCIKYYYKILMQFYVKSIKYKVIISDFFCDCSLCIDAH